MALNTHTNSERKAEDHYDAHYHHTQVIRGNIVDKSKASFLAGFIAPSSVVLDFGCGRGGILSRIPCEKRFGLEINSHAAADAEKNGLSIYTDLKNVPDASMDVITSNHSFEHVLEPSQVLKQFKRILKPGGRLVVIVPAERPNARQTRQWVTEDRDQHLHSWTPLSLGNLVKVCGLEIEDTMHKKLGFSKYIEFLYPIKPLYELARSLTSFVLDRYEVVCIARKP